MVVEVRSTKSWVYIALVVLIGFLTFQNDVGSVESSDPNILFLPIIRQGDPVWPIGPDGGHIVSIAIDPSNAAVMYAGTWGAGVYKSIDGGNSWKLINSGLGNYYINTIAIDPINTSIVYLGTQMDGVYKTSDGGSSWVPAGSGLNQDAIVYTIAIDPSTPTTLYAGTRSPGTEPPWGGGVYKSDDGGSTWQVRNQGLGEEWVYSIAINPISTNELYAATHSSGVHKSQDGASSWSAVNTGLADLATRSLEIDPGNPAIVLVGTWHTGSVFRTTNGGSSWSNVGSELGNAKIYRLKRDPSNPAIVYAATYKSGVSKSVDGGNVWNSSGLWPDFIYDVAVDPSSSTNVFVGTAGDGLYRSEDSGTSWSRSDSGLKATSVTSIFQDPSTPGTIYVSVFGGGVYKSSDLGFTWEEMNTGLSDKQVHTLVMAPDDPLRLFAGTDDSGVYVSSDGGGSWSSSNSGFPAFSVQSKGFSLPFYHVPESEFIDQGVLEEFSLPPDRKKGLTFGGTDIGILEITIDQTTPSTIYVGTDGDGVFRSVDGGNSWSSTGLTAVRVNSIEIDPVNSANIYAGVSGSDGSLLWSFNAGTDWLFKNVGLDGKTVYSLAFDPQVATKMFAGTTDGVYESTNAGNSWAPSSLSGVAVYSLKIDPSDPQSIFAGAKDGFYVSKDGGATWVQDNRGLINLVVQTVHFTGKDIYLGSNGGGAYRRRSVLP